MRPIHLGTLMSMLLVSSLSAACAPIHVTAFAERGVPFNFRTYAWAQGDAVSTGDPRLDNNPFFADCVRSAVDRELAARGFEQTASGAPDLRLHFHATLGQEIAVTNGRDRFEHCNGCSASVYDAGTLMLDFVDARTTRLVWRGWAEKVPAVIDNQDWMEETIDLVVTRILEKLPPRGA